MVCGHEGGLPVSKAPANSEHFMACVIRCYILLKTSFLYIFVSFLLFFLDEAVVYPKQKKIQVAKRQCYQVRRVAVGHAEGDR